MTITTGYLDQTMLIVPENQDSWADLGSSPYTTWSSWTTWCSSPTNIVVTFTDDIGAVEYRTPLLTVNAEGSVSTSLDISTTGSFTGEETNIPFVSGVEYDYPQGRYFRWTITVASTVDVDVPILRTYATRYNQEYVTEYLDDYDVYAATSTGITPSLTTQLGFVKHIQATAHQGPSYVEAGYVVDSEPFRTQVPITTTSMALEPGTPFSESANSLDFASVNDLPTGNILVDSSSVLPVCATENQITIETWVKYNQVSSTQDKYVLDVHNPIVFPTSSQFAIRMSYDGAHFQIRIIGDSLGILDSNLSPGIQPDQWYHIAYTYDGTTHRLFVNGLAQATNTSAQVFNSSNTRFVIGGQDLKTSEVSDLEGNLVGFRISKTALYTSTFTLPSSLPGNDVNTVFLLKSALEDENGFDSGVDPYIQEQRGGVAQIESKNPPTLQVVDFEGNPWDGTVDVMLVGLPKIIATVDGVEQS